MREINLDTPSSQRRTILAYGATRTGKTHWAASAPRPLFISDATESGWTTVQNMDRGYWYEPQVKPQIWAIETVTDMALAFAKALPLVQAGNVRTIIVDSLTFYADLYLAHLYNILDSKDTRKIYGALGIHLRDLRTKWHSLPCNIIWLCLTKEPDEENKVGGPLIPGQQAAKFTAGCDSILYLREAGSGTKREFCVHTKRFQNYIAGGREGARAVVDPLPAPTFQAYLDAIGDPLQDVDSPVPPIQLTPTPASQAQARPSGSSPQKVVRSQSVAPRGQVIRRTAS